MPLPRRLAQFNKVVTNRLFAPLAGRIPPWIVIEHVGRRSGRVYHTVVWAFPYRHDLVIALTYGPSSDWVRNVVAAGACRARWLTRWRNFSSVELLSGPAAQRVLPPGLGALLAVGGVRTVLHLQSR